MRSSSALIALALATAATAVAPADATARYYHHHHYYSGYAISPYGHATPHYDTRYGRYPAYTYDPDPRLRAMLRTDFNRGVNAMGR